jgi:hypothetical protein
MPIGIPFALYSALEREVFVDHTVWLEESIAAKGESK